MNEIQAVTKNVRLQQWASIIQDCKASGIKVDDYCAEHNLSRNAYYYWLRKIKEAAIKQPGNLFAEVNSSFATTAQENADAPSISIRIGDAVIYVEEGTSSCLLHQVIEAVRNA